MFTAAQSPSVEADRPAAEHGAVRSGGQREPGAARGYHLGYGFSCMGYEIAGGLWVKMANPRREVIVMVGDGSYLMLNSEIATSVAPAPWPTRRASPPKPGRSSARA